MPDERGEIEAFRTLNGYREAEKMKITPSMEDYLEMIMRLSSDGEAVRVCNLARKLITQLCEKGCVYAERYGDVTLTEYGRNMGTFLMRRHETIHAFFCMLNGSRCELSQTEKVEHFIEPHTLASMERALELYKEKE